MANKRNAANSVIAEKITGAQPVAEAVKTLKTFKGPRFDQTVEVCVCKTSKAWTEGTSPHLEYG